MKKIYCILQFFSKYNKFIKKVVITLFVENNNIYNLVPIHFYAKSNSFQIKFETGWNYPIFPNFNPNAAPEGVEKYLPNFAQITFLYDLTNLRGTAIKKLSSKFKDPQYIYIYYAIV